jgi:hypothetical protein
LGRLKVLIGSVVVVLEVQTVLTNVVIIARENSFVLTEIMTSSIIKLTILLVKTEEPAHLIPGTTSFLYFKENDILFQVKVAILFDIEV